MSRMNARTTMSAEGQVVIPEDVWEELGLRPGEPIELAKVQGGVLLRPVPRKSGRSFDEIEAEIRRIVRYDGPPVSIEQMNDTIAQCWEEAALRSDR